MNSFVRLLFYCHCQNVVATKYMPMESTLKNKMHNSITPNILNIKKDVT